MPHRHTHDRLVTAGEPRRVILVHHHPTNTTNRTVYLARCTPASPQPIYSIELIESNGSDWGSAYSPAWGCVGHDQQIAVVAGGTRVDTFHITGPNSWDGVTHKPFGTLTGRMRLVYAVQSCRGDGQCPLPSSTGRSNAFFVQLGP